MLRRLEVSTILYIPFPVLITQIHTHMQCNANNVVCYFITVWIYVEFAVLFRKLVHLLQHVSTSYSVHVVRDIIYILQHS